MAEIVRLRFAPSPTGPLHLGGTRTALFNYLFARRKGGSFILRIEDTDPERSRPEFEEDLLQALSWLGLDWDEGPGKDGAYGPYRQSLRKELYAEPIERLANTDHVYPCYCTRDELEAERDEARAKGRPPRYSGRCRSEDHRRRMAPSREAEILRFRVPEKEEIVVPDLLRGEVTFSGDSLGDFVLCRRDDEGRWQPLYNLAAVIDDHLMGITHIVRGDDHLSNTPLQILIYGALGWTPPRFAHHGLILDLSGAKMSKRFGAVPVNSYRERGFLPEALVNYLALLGWSPEDGVETKSLAELAGSFALERLGAAPVHFDQERLIHFNRLHLRALPLTEIVTLVNPYLLQDYGVTHRSPGTAYGDERWLELLVGALREEVADLRELSHRARFAFVEELSPDPGAQEALETEAAGAVLTDFGRRLRAGDRIDVGRAHQLLREIRDELHASLGLKGREVMFPIRASLAGTVRGPELAVIVALLGPERCQDRIRKVLDR